MGNVFSFFFFFAGYDADHEGLTCYVMCDIKGVFLLQLNDKVGSLG